MTTGSCEAVMLMGFGGPTVPAEVRPFLNRVLAGRPVPPERYEEVVRHYEALGGRSPYNELTIRLSASLQELLARIGMSVPVVVAFRHALPFFDDALRQLRDRGIRRTLGFVLAAHRSEASWNRYLAELNLARERLDDAPEIEYPPLWHDQPGFIEAVSDRACAALNRMDGGARSSAKLIFTAHSIPLAMNGRSGYVEQLERSAQLVAHALGRPTWTIAFQSRSGSPREPWLEPDLGSVVRGMAGGFAVVIPIGFLCDHVEVLYDLDIEAARIAREVGLTMERAATVGDHPKFVQMIANIACSYLSPGR
jgi:protoporphyrin/coproporphyrin ferrochelatase